jgi:cytochrome c oxidase subunit 2
MASNRNGRSEGVLVDFLSYGAGDRFCHDRVHFRGSGASLRREATRRRGNCFAGPAVACAGAGLLSACSGPLSTLDSAGPAAASIASLWWVMLIGATLIFATVMTLLALAFIRPGVGRGTPASWWLVGGGLAFPAVVLTPLLIYALWSGERLFPTGDPSVTNVDVIARQWEWSFTYRKADGAAVRSSNILHIEAGRPVQLNITSTDVIHSFWVPRLAGKIDAIPGHMTVLQLKADVPGIYRGVCAEFCGTSHLEMQFSVEAHAPDGFVAVLGALKPAGTADVNAPRERP